MNELVNEGVVITTQKRDLSKQMNDLAKERAKEIGLTKKQLIQIKDYKHYQGRGWGEDALDKSEEKESYPDRVSPTFRKLVEIITNLNDANMLDFLKPYIGACEKRGVYLTIDIKRDSNIDLKKELLDATLNEMDTYQCDICQLNDRITDELAPQAENDKYVPKTKFKDIVERAYKMENHNADKETENIDKTLAKNEMYSNALNDVKSI